MSELFEVVEVQIKAPHTEQVLESNLIEKNAAAVVNLAVMRRGVETHFYVARPMKAGAAS